ncbi:hypothetical protein CC80DRAFT_495331 [Byssothecium circinans]|uniref:Uncharacterized protein n=1 Tax=Byssothecium circinans TaxID=147558 RepID=A0A6A5TIU7_9PLEO|nr:hypothetical protein CC80DRAFT_495331 [Byssothecium circinans]
MDPIKPPKRVVLRFSVQYENEEAAINEAFFAKYGPKPIDDFYSHLMAPNESPKMHIILDLYCKTNAVIDPLTIEYQVFKVRKRDNFVFEQLNSAACEYARTRCSWVRWGTT